MRSSNLSLTNSPWEKKLILMLWVQSRTMRSRLSESRSMGTFLEAREWIVRTTEPRTSSTMVASQGEEVGETGRNTTQTSPTTARMTDQVVRWIISPDLRRGVTGSSITTRGPILCTTTMVADPMMWSARELMVLSQQVKASQRSWSSTMQSTRRMITS